MERTLVDGGMPLRNQAITCDVEQIDAPILTTVRSADAFGELLMELDLVKGTAWSRLVTINRSLTGKDCTPSPRPEYAFDRLISTAQFEPVREQPVRLKIRTQGEHVTVWANDREIYAFTDPDPAGGKFGLGSTGRMRLRMCSGNGAWGDDPDTTHTWARVRPLWDVLTSIDWDHLVDARPWYAQELVSGDGFFAANYTAPTRAVIVLANRAEQTDRYEVRIDRDRLPPQIRKGAVRYCLGRSGEIGTLSDKALLIELPPLHGGPIGIEIVVPR